MHFCNNGFQKEFRQTDQLERAKIALFLMTYMWHRICQNKRISNFLVRYFKNKNAFPAIGLTSVKGALELTDKQP